MRAKLPWIVAGLLLVLVGVRFTVFNQPPPKDPRERIREIFREGKQAYEAEDVDTLLSFVADDFEASGLDKQRLRYQLASFFKNVSNPRVEYKEPTIEVFGARAIARTDVTIRWQDDGPNSQHFGAIEIEFRKERGRRWGIFPYEDWKVVRIMGVEWNWLQ